MSEGPYFGICDIHIKASKMEMTNEGDLMKEGNINHGRNLEPCMFAMCEHKRNNDILRKIKKAAF